MAEIEYLEMHSLDFSLLVVHNPALHFQTT